MERPDPVIIRCENIHKKFKSKTVLEDISFAVNRGEFLSLLGPSGCGKTTILRMLIGIEKPSSGKIIKDGVDITDTPPKDRNIGIVFQNYSLFPNMDVYHNISYALQNRKDGNGRPMGKEEIDRKVREIILVKYIYQDDDIMKDTDSPNASWRGIVFRFERADYAESIAEMKDRIVLFDAMIDSHVNPSEFKKGSWSLKDGKLVKE